ncbi:MAG: glycosyltransferase family 9 protein [Planctomycetes bacterium]|nr:glycosyltransferase family 9 protein [Planctomycetota bacterium]
MNLSFAKAIDRHVGRAVCAMLSGLRFLRELVSPRTDVVEARTILCIKFWGLGNIVLLLPVLRRLRERHPGARILFVTLRRNEELLGACPSIDRAIYVDDRGAARLVATYLLAVFRALRESPDVAIDFEQFARSSVILAVLARSKQVVGLSTSERGRSALYHKIVRYDDRQHMGQTFLDLARAAGVADCAYRPEPFDPGDAARRAADSLLATGGGSGPLVVLHPGSGDNFQGRRWPARSFAQLADRLIRGSGARIVVTGSPGEAALVGEVIGFMEEKGRAIDASGRLSVLGLAALLARSAALVTNDTAPVHIGSALGTAVFALFGPNTPVLYGPLSAGSHAFYRGLPCSPCLTNMNYKTSHCRMPVCISEITVAEVHQRVATRVAALRGADVASADGLSLSPGTERRQVEATGDGGRA